MYRFEPKKVYVEKESENYELGKMLIDRYKESGIEIVSVDDHRR